MNSESAISQTPTRDNDQQQENDEVPELPRRSRRQSHMRLSKGISNEPKQPTLTHLLRGTVVAYSGGPYIYTNVVAMRQWVT